MRAGVILFLWFAPACARSSTPGADVLRRGRLNYGPDIYSQIGRAAAAQNLWPSSFIVTIFLYFFAAALSVSGRTN